MKTNNPTLNGTILVYCRAIKCAVSLSAEVKTVGVFHNAQLPIPIQHILEKLNHLQPPIPIKTNNSTATGFTHKNIY